MTDFDPAQYGSCVARVLALDGNGQRLIPLTSGNCASPEVYRLLKATEPREFFPGATDTAAAMAGLWLYFSCLEEAHEIVAKSDTRECEFWHAILHRQEPDSGNAAYWFRKVGTHPVFSNIAHAAVRILERYPHAEFRTGKWDPFAFIAFCERARSQPGSEQEQAALEIQRAEWQALFDYCARPARNAPGPAA
jgi:hypothetical protein